MDKVTQATAANAEESASASEELSAQAEQLNEIVQELSALVGGSKSRNTGTQKTHSKPTRTAHLSASDTAFHQIASGKATQKKETAKPEKHAIPLTQDEFEAFNS
jgi:methyl-accepting chemotaxis protein